MELARKKAEEERLAALEVERLRKLAAEEQAKAVAKVRVRACMCREDIQDGTNNVGKR